MYNSPIEIIYNEMQTKINEQLENDILSAVLQYGIKVNKEELIKALEYDRNQYKKGFDDGYEKGRQDLIDYLYGKMKGGAE